MCNTKRFSGVFGLKVGLGLFNPCELWDARARKLRSPGSSDYVAA